MASGSGLSSDRFWRVAAAIGILSLLAVVATASGASRPSGSGVGIDSSWVLDAAAALGTIALLTTVAMFAFAFWPGRGQRQERRNIGERSGSPSLLTRSLIGLVWIGVFLGLAPVLHRPGAGRSLIQVPAGGTPRSGVPVVPRPSGGAILSVNTWVVVGAVLATAVAGVTAYLLWRRRPLAPDEPAQAVPDRSRTAATALLSLDDLLAAARLEPDNRRAVIAAYVGMEQSLARAGLPRADWEAPFEFLDRVLPELGVATSVGARLTGLFEHARFSRRDVGPDMKGAAVDALVEIRRELEPVG